MATKHIQPIREEASWIASGNGSFRRDFRTICDMSMGDPYSLTVARILVRWSAIERQCRASFAQDRRRFLQLSLFLRPRDYVPNAFHASNRRFAVATELSTYASKDLIPLQVHRSSPPLSSGRILTFDTGSEAAQCAVCRLTPGQFRDRYPATLAERDIFHTPCLRFIQVLP